jgi:hypothetical protein
MFRPLSAIIRCCQFTIYSMYLSMTEQKVLERINSPAFLYYLTIKYQLQFNYGILSILFFMVTSHTVDTVVKH